MTQDRGVILGAAGIEPVSAQVGMDVAHQLGRDGTVVVQSEVSVGCPTYY